MHQALCVLESKLEMIYGSKFQINHKVCAEITYLSPNVNGATVGVWEWSHFIHQFVNHDITNPCLGRS